MRSIARSPSSSTTRTSSRWTSEGDVSDKLNPRFNALMKIQQVLAACEKELGFTPVSRARVKVDAKEEEQDEYDGF